MSRITLAERRAAHLERIKEFEDELDLYQQKGGQVQTRHGSGPWVDATEASIAKAKYWIGVYKKFVADIDERIAADEE